MNARIMMVVDKYNKKGNSLLLIKEPRKAGMNMIKRSIISDPKNQVKENNNPSTNVTVVVNAAIAKAEIAATRVAALLVEFHFITGANYHKPC